MRLKNFTKISTLCILLLSLGNTANTQPAESVIYTLKDSVLVDSLNIRAQGYRLTNLDSMNYYAKQAFSIAQQIEYIPGRIKAAQQITTELLLKGNYSDAIDLLFQEKLELDTLSFPKESAIVNYTIGLVYSASQNYKAGLPYLIEAVDRFRDLQDSTYYIRTLNNIGVGYIRLEQFDKALQIFKELEKSEDLLEIGIRTTMIINLVYCYYGLNDLYNSKKLINKFLALPEVEVDERGYGFAYFKLGEIYEKEGQIQKAIASFNSALAVFDKFKTEPNKIEVYNALAKVHFSQNQFDLALTYANKGLAIAKSKSILPYEKIVLDTHYKILKAQGKFEEALNVFERYKNVSDSLIETQQSAEMGRIIAQYEFNRQRYQLQFKQKQAELENQEIQNKQKLTIQISIVIILAIVLLLALIYRGYILKLRGNKLLTEKNKEIQQQRDRLDETNKIKNKLLSIIGHDLKSPISSLNGLLYLLKNKIANKEDLDTVLPKLIDNFDITSNLLNNLLNWTRSQMEGYTLEFNTFDIHDLLTRVVGNAKFRLEDKNIQCDLEGQGTSVYAEENMIEIVCQNLVDNAIKFCENGGKIKIKIETGQQVCLSFGDSGVGISQDRIASLLDGTKFSSTVGTKNERGSGLGLTICKDFLEKNNSKLCIRSENKKGSIFSFCLPKNA